MGMKLAVFGSRTITDDRVEAEISEFLQQNAGYDTIVTSQEPKGVCAVAQQYAKHNGIVLELHFLDFDKYARGAWCHRSEHIISAADYVLLIHDGVSKGTANELEQTRKRNKPHKCIVLEKTTELERSKGTDILTKDIPKSHELFVPDLFGAELVGADMV